MSALLALGVLLVLSGSALGQPQGPITEEQLEAQQTFQVLLSTSLAPFAGAVLANPPLAEEIAQSPLVDRLHQNQSQVAALVGSPVVNEVLNNPTVIANLEQDPSLAALLVALPPAQASALNDIINGQSTGNAATDLNNLQASIGAEVGVPVPAVSASSAGNRKLLQG